MISFCVEKKANTGSGLFVAIVSLLDLTLYISVADYSHKGEHVHRMGEAKSTI